MNETFDILDENGGFTGLVLSRDEAHKTGAWHRAVALYLVNSKKQVLLQKRSKHKRTWAGCWDFTCGGHVDAGELGLASIIREAEEELGIDLSASEVRYMCGYRSDNKNEKMWDRHHNEYYIALKDIDIAKIKLQQGEVDEIKWVDYADFKKMVAQKDSTLTSKWHAHEAFVRYFERYGDSK